MSAYSDLRVVTCVPRIKVGDEIVHVVNQANADERFVWTWVDGDDGTYILNGYHHVNRIGYFITEVPCVTDAMEIVVDKYEESEDDE